MRRMIAIACMLAMLILGLAGCRRIVEPDAEAISVYATFYPIYALTDAVMRDVPDAELHCLVQPQDGCLRDYQLSDWDIYLLASADAVISGGRGLESFEDTLFGWGDAGPAASAVLYNLELYNQGTAAADAELESHLDGENPHLYMSIEGASRIVESISAMMVSMDPKYAEKYVDNMEAALQKLQALRDQTRELMVDYAGGRVILMNEALIYMAQDYGLEVADWIDRESGVGMYDDELQDCVDRLLSADASVILIEKQAPRRLVEALEAAGFSVARIDILSTRSEEDGFNTYMQAQISNAQAMRDAFDRSTAKEAAN